MADLFANPVFGRHVFGSAAISPDLATDVIQRFLVARDQNHLGALLRSASGRRQPDTGRAAGADASLLLARLEFHYTFLWPGKTRESEDLARQGGLSGCGICSLHVHLPPLPEKLGIVLAASPADVRRMPRCSISLRQNG